MANILGIQSGLRADSIKRVRKRKAPALPVTEILCTACAGVLQQKRGRFSTVSWGDEGQCHFCAGFFGFDSFRGVTNLSAQDSLKRIANLREHGWGILLRTQQLAEGSGITVEIGCGDIFKIMRAGAEGRMQERESCCRARTMELFSTHIQVGPCDVKLWPHEISPISFLTIMELRRAGEIEESFVAAEDEQGYFKPTIDIPWR